MKRFTIFKNCIHRFIILLVVGSGVAGCAPSMTTQRAVEDYPVLASTVSIGDAKEYVLSILQSNQDLIPAHFRKRHEQYLSYGETVEIHFARTDLASGIANSDEDFTPYVFRNDILVSVGWRYVSKTDFLEKAREAMSAGGARADLDVIGDRR